MRVLHVRSTTGCYGAEVALLTLATAQAGLGLRPVIAAIGPRGAGVPELVRRARAASLAAEWVPCAARLDWRCVLAVRRLGAEADVVHSHDYKSDLFAYLGLRLGVIPLAATCHAWTSETLRVRAYEMLDARLLRRFDAVAAVASWVADRLAAGGIRRSRLWTIPNAIAPPAPSSTPLGGFRRQLGLAPAERLISAIGRLSPEKGHHVLLDAVARLRAAGATPGFAVALVGDGPCRERLLRQARALGLTGVIRACGFVPDPADVYRDSDIVVLPSLTEGLPLALLEAMSHGRAIVASDVGGVPTVVEHRESAMLVRPGDSRHLAEALGELLTCDRARSMLGERARRAVPAWSDPAGMATRYSAMYGAMRRDRSGPGGDGTVRPDV